jgi:hypothetical protein
VSDAKKWRLASENCQWEMITGVADKYWAKTRDGDGSGMGKYQKGTIPEGRATPKS